MKMKNLNNSKDKSTDNQSSDNSQSSDNPSPQGEPGSDHSHPGDDRVLTTEFITLASSKPKNSNGNPAPISTDEDSENNNFGDIGSNHGGDQAPQLSP